MITGDLVKMRIEPGDTARYFLRVGDEEIPLASWLGQSVKLRFTGNIHCLACGQATKKSYSQGYCYPCSQRLASCDLCIVRPERCHYHLGTCREPEWGEANCLQPHVVYLANSSGVKVGITRLGQVPTRWLDQGARQALPILMTQTRLQSGRVETLLAEHIADKTDWRKLLKGDAPERDLPAEWERLRGLVEDALAKLELPAELQAKLPGYQEFHYPVHQYPTKVSSLNPEKNPEIEGTLWGLKGQYWILDRGVLNIRKFGGYEVVV